MQVLGDLVKLPANSDLPLPWWHRAPLGLQAKTWCYVGFVESNKRPTADLIVSVLNPSHWGRMVRVTCSHNDEPGVVSKAIETVKDFNIALAESVTVEAGDLHEITLFCEPVGQDDKVPSRNQLKKQLESLGFNDVKVDAVTARPVSWVRKGEIKGGWIRNVDWRTEIEKRYRDDSSTVNVDFSKAVVSCDTTNRLLRFTFPFKNARTIRVEHLDEKGVLRKLTDVIFAQNLNMLSKLLRRGGARPGNAMLLAICEPKGGYSGDGVFNDLKKQIDGMPSDLMTETTISDGLEANRTITPREVDTVIARVPANLVEKVRQIRTFVPNGELSFFLSRRFVNEPRAIAIADAVRTAVAGNKCHLLEASPEDDVTGPNLIFTEVSAKMWVADGGIMLVSGLKQGEPLGKNLPHEFGFLQGQSKPILLLVESSLNGSHALWSNVDGVYAPRFPSDEVAFLAKERGSIHDIVTKWIAALKKSGVTHQTV